MVLDLVISSTEFSAYRLQNFEIYFNIATVGSMYILLNAQFECYRNIARIHVYGHCPHIASYGAFNMRLNVAGHHSHRNADTCYCKALKKKLAMTRHSFDSSMKFVSNLTNLLEVFVQILLANHHVFTDKLLAASHDDDWKLLIGILFSCYWCSIELRRLTELRMEIASILGISMHGWIAHRCFDYERRGTIRELSVLVSPFQYRGISSTDCQQSQHCLHGRPSLFRWATNSIGFEPMNFWSSSINVLDSEGVDDK